MTDKNKTPEPERSSGNEVECSDLLAESNQRKILEAYDLLEQWGRRVATCDNMLSERLTTESEARIRTKRGVIISMKMEVQRILNQNFS